MQTEQNAEVTQNDPDSSAMVEGAENPTLEPWEQANVDAQAAIDAIAADFNADDGEDTEAAGTPSEAADQVDAAAPEQPASEESAKDDRSVARIVEREVAIRRREDEIAAKEQHLKSLETELSALREKAASYQGDFHDNLRLKVGDTLRAAGHDPEHVVRLYLAEKMVADGKPVPPELQRLLDKADYDHRYRELNHRQSNFERQQEAARWVAGIELGARTYLNQGISKDAPTFAAVAKANPDWAYQAIMDEIVADVRSRGGKDLSTTVLTYDDAAKRAEAKLAAHKKLLGLSDPPHASTAAPNGAAPTTPVRQAVAKGSSPTAPKPLVAKKQLSQKELEEQAIADAVSEFKRVEAAKKSSVRS